MGLEPSAISLTTQHSYCHCVNTFKNNGFFLLLMCKLRINSIINLTAKCNLAKHCWPDRASYSPCEWPVQMEVWHAKDFCPTPCVLTTVSRQSQCWFSSLSASSTADHQPPHDTTHCTPAQLGTGILHSDTRGSCTLCCENSYLHNMDKKGPITRNLLKDQVSWAHQLSS